MICIFVVNKMYQGWVFFSVRSSFQPKLNQLSILPEKLNEYQHLLGDSLRWISVSSRESQDSHPLNTTETGDMHWLHGPLGL